MPVSLTLAKDLDICGMRASELNLIHMGAKRIDRA
jgi:hypothetical protein